MATRGRTRPPRCCWQRGVLEVFIKKRIAAPPSALKNASRELEVAQNNVDRLGIHYLDMWRRPRFRVRDTFYVLGELELWKQFPFDCSAPGASARPSSI